MIKNERVSFMREYVLMTDSSCDLPDELAKELGLTVLPLSFVQDGKTYRNYLDCREMPSKVFYKNLRDGHTAVTSGVNIDAATTAMEEILKSGRDILCLNFSSALSCTYASCVSAANELREKYRERTIEVVDTLAASLGQGLLVYLTAQKKKAGAALAEARDFAERMKQHVCHWFTVDDLMHLRRGGRVSTATAIVGSMLSIKPVMHTDDAGKLTPVGKVRGRKKSILALLEKMEELVIDPEKQTVFISHGDCEEDAQFLAEQIKARFHIKDILIHPVGPVIGAHSGPGTLALFFIGQHR